MKILLIAGMPGVGKTTISEFLSKRYSAPVLCKDSFKEVLFDEIGFVGIAEKDRLDRTATREMMVAAACSIKAGHSVILESNFCERDKAYIKEAEKLSGVNAVTLKIDCDIDVLYRRLLERDLEPDRHPAHATNTKWPIPEGEEYVYAPMWDQAEFTENVESTGVRAFTYGTTVFMDTTDFSTVDYEKVAGELDKYML